MELRSYQKHGVAFIRQVASMLQNAAERAGAPAGNGAPLRSSFLADDPGLGKTGQFISATLDLLKLKNHPIGGAVHSVLVLTPSIGRVSWAVEAPKWLPKDWTIASVKADPGGAAQHRTLYVCSYDLAVVNEKVRSWLLSQNWSVLGLDEAHYLKGHEAKRTRLVYGNKLDGKGDCLVAKSHVAILLSGTPTPNHAGEIWTHLNALRPELLKEAGIGSRIEFEDKFCQVRVGLYGRQITGSKNQDQLRRLCKTFILRRRKQDVLKELPAIQVQDVPLDLSDKDRAQAASLAAKLAGSVFAAAGGEAPESDDDLIELLNKSGAHIASARRALGIMKAPAAAAWVRARYDNGTKKQIVFAHHRDVLDILHDEIGLNCVRVDGSTPNEERIEAVKAFQDDPNVSVFLGQIQAAGTAITLTAASEVVMVEADWVPANNDQAISRAHRFGQKNGVLATFLFMPGTIDQRIMSAFRRKAQQTASIYDTPDTIKTGVDAAIAAPKDAAKAAQHAVAFSNAASQITSAAPLTQANITDMLNALRAAKSEGDRQMRDALNQNLFDDPRSPHFDLDRAKAQYEARRNAAAAQQYEIEKARYEMAEKMRHDQSALAPKPSILGSVLGSGLLNSMLGGPPGMPEPPTLPTNRWRNSYVDDVAQDRAALLNIVQEAVRESALDIPDSVPETTTSQTGEE